MKKTKENVYVVIDTPKKAKKVKKVLDMFGERIEIYTKKTLVDYNQPWTTDREGIPAINYITRSGFIGDHVHNIKDKTEVSIKELRNILAVEHLKEGDVVVCRNKKSDTHIFEIKEKEENLVSYDKRYSFVDNGTYEESGHWSLDYFLRYATEEEKALLEDKPKSIEVGKWYTFAWSDQPNTVRGIYFIEKVEDIKVWFSYGIDFTENEWQSKDWCNVGHVWKEATKEDVEQALIKEAKKRYKVGDNVNQKSAYNGHGGKYMLKNIDNISYHQSDNNLSIDGIGVFKNGKWAEIVEPSFVESSDKIKVAGENIGKRVRVIDGGSGATGCNGQTGIIVEKPNECLNGSLKPVIYVKLDNGHTWGLGMDHKIEYLTESSPLTVTLEIKDIATLKVIQKTLKELE